MRLFRFSSLTLLVALVATGCDQASVDPNQDPTPVATATVNEDAAVSIANALALDSGGALDVLAEAAEIADAASNSQGDAACTRDRSYDETAQTWTGFVECERGRPDGLFYALYSRTRTFQFLGADGTPQQSPDGAQTLNFAVVDGEGLRRRPNFTHDLLDIGADLVVDDLQADLVTVNGTYSRAATDTLNTIRAQRTLIYDLAMTFIDVQGPRGARRANWPGAVSGTIEGTYDAVRTLTTADGTREQTINRSFTITFGEDGTRDIARIRLGDTTFVADLSTGEVDGLD